MQTNLILKKLESIEDTCYMDAGQIKTDWLGHKFVFLHDPDGNVVELHE